MEMTVGVSQVNGSAPAGKTPGQRLRRLRQQAGIKSASEAARKLHMPRETYYQHEAGYNAVTAKQAEAYGEFYGVPAAMILYGDDMVVYPEVLPKPRRTRVIGQVNDRGLIQPLGPRQAPWLPSFRGASVLEAVVIASDALAPTYYRGDHVLFAPLVQPLAPEEVDGREVVLTVDYGRKMLAQVEQRAGREDWVIRVPNRRAIIGRQLYLASRVVWIKRA
jgi:transcriptional regulator with XRE-family HTH domain